jgi:hypothetical protein
MISHPKKKSQVAVSLAAPPLSSLLLPLPGGSRQDPAAVRQPDSGTKPPIAAGSLGHDAGISFLFLSSVGASPLGSSPETCSLGARHGPHPISPCMPPLARLAAVGSAPLFLTPDRESSPPPLVVPPVTASRHGRRPCGPRPPLKRTKLVLGHQPPRLHR